MALAPWITASSRHNTAADTGRLRRFATEQIEIEYFLQLIRDSLDVPYAEFLPVAANTATAASRTNNPPADPRKAIVDNFSKLVSFNNRAVSIEDLYRTGLAPARSPAGQIDISACLGVPVQTSQGHPVAVLCAFDKKTRNWTSTDRTVLQGIANCLGQHLEMRAAKQKTDAKFDALSDKYSSSRRYNAAREQLIKPMTNATLTCTERVEALLAAGCNIFEMDCAAILKVNFSKAHVAYAYRVNPDRLHTPFSLKGTLTEEVMFAGITHFSSGPSEPAQPLKCHILRAPQSYAGEQLALGKVAFGTLEFVSASSKPEIWNSESLSLLSLLAQLCCGLLSTDEQIKTFRRCEDARLLTGHRNAWFAPQE